MACLKSDFFRQDVKSRGKNLSVIGSEEVMLGVDCAGSGYSYVQDYYFAVDKSTGRNYLKASSIKRQ